VLFLRGSPLTGKRQEHLELFGRDRGIYDIRLVSARTESEASWIPSRRMMR
jgi:hypothetical protein